MSAITLVTKGIISTKVLHQINDVLSGGKLIIQPGWQMVTIPIQYGYFDKQRGILIHDNATLAKIKNYVMDQIEFIIGYPLNSFIEIAKCYTGNENAFLSYIPGLTKDNSFNNFYLAKDDATGLGLEYVPFWIKSLYTEPIVINWGI